jgi:hypothetical protein
MDGIHLEAKLLLAGIYTAAIYMLPSVTIGQPVNGVYKVYGLPWMESRLKPRTAAMDGLSNRYCLRLIYNDILSF